MHLFGRLSRQPEPAACAGELAHASQSPLACGSDRREGNRLDRGSNNHMFVVAEHGT